MHLIFENGYKYVIKVLKVLLEVYKIDSSDIITKYSRYENGKFKEIEIMGPSIYQAEILAIFYLVKDRFQTMPPLGELDITNEIEEREKNVWQANETKQTAEGSEREISLTEEDEIVAREVGSLPEV